MCDRDATDKCKERSGFEGRIENNILIGPDFPIHREPINMSQIILETFRSRPDCIGQIDGITNKQNTYADMSERSIKCALWLKKQGVKPGAIIGICIDNHLDAILVLLGVMYINAIANTWDHELSPMTARHFLLMTSPEIIFTIPSSAASITEALKELKMDVKIVVFDHLDGYVSLDEVLKDHDNCDITEFKCAPISNLDDVGLIILSSGTTGVPKATEISHSSLYDCLHPKKIAEMKDVYLNEICIFTPTIRWHYGILLAFGAIVSYATRIVIPDIVTDDCDNDTFCEYIEKYQVTCVATDAFMLIRLIKSNSLEKYQLPTLKTIRVTGATFSKNNQEIISKKLPHVFINNTYGSTDSGSELTAQKRYKSKPGSVGFPRPNVQIKVVNLEIDTVLEANKIGELRVKVPFLMNGYYKNPEATKKAFDSDGWLRTGDLGYYDEDGEVFIVGRISDFINFRSINVSSEEIANVLQTHPAVLQAVVIGIPHEVDEQHPMGIVSVIPGKTVTAQELISFIEKNLPDHCRLRAGVKFIDKIPQTITGKVMKRKLQEMFQRNSSELRDS